MTNPPPHPDREYVLGTGDDELDRLELQHRLWSDLCAASWRRAGIRPGMRVLDLGCGPGFAACDLAQLVGPAGMVVGVDESARFIDILCAKARALGQPRIRAIVGDAHALPAAALQHAPFDAAYLRWVLCFVPDPAAVLRGVHEALAPGGRIVIHDYFDWRCMTAAPRSDAIDKLINASAASWRQRGGDPDIVGRLPRLLREAGFTLTHIDINHRIARGGTTSGRRDPMLDWPLAWWRTYSPKLVGMGLLSQPECNAGLAELDAIEHDPDRFFVTPPVYELIAVA